MNKPQETIKPNLIAINNENWVSKYAPILQLGLVDYHRLPGCPNELYMMDDIHQFLEEDGGLLFKSYNKFEHKLMNSTISKLLRVGMKLKIKRQSVSSRLVNNKHMQQLEQDMVSLRALQSQIKQQFSTKDVSWQNVLNQLEHTEQS